MFLMLKMFKKKKQIYNFLFKIIDEFIYIFITITITMKTFQSSVSQRVFPFKNLGKNIMLYYMI